MTLTRSMAFALLMILVGCGSADDEPASPSATGSADESETSPAPTATAPVGSETTGPPSASPASGALYDDSLRAGVPNQAPGYRLAYYGDSLAHSAQEHVVEALDAGLRFEFVERTFPGSAMCDWFDEIAQDRQTGLWGAVLLFSNNTFTPCMADEAGDRLTGEAAFDKFSVDLQTAVGDLRASGVRVYLPTLPITRSAAELEIDDVAIYNELFAELADGDDGVTVVDAAAAVLGPDGSYVEALPCLPVEPCVGGVDDDGVAVNLVREPDGAHFCSGGYGEGVEIVPGNCPGWSSGAFRYAAALTKPIVEDGYAEWAADPASQDPIPTP
ncbi:MAG: hypothetical protein ACR2QE_14695 [Acidimicrobiales bacterium]